MKFDVVIIGGGPAGLSAALALANTTATVAVVEKESYPRDKTCAGILTQKTVSFLNEKFPQMDVGQFHSTNQVTVFYKNEQSIHFSPKSMFTLVDRRQFDYSLYSICKDSKTCFFENQKVVNINPNHNTLVLNNGEKITYNFLIAADGAHSIIRKFLGLQEMSLAFCIQDYFDKRFCPDSLKHMQELQLYFGNIPFGYSWVVPSNEGIAVGTGAFTKYVDWPQMQLKHNELCSKCFHTDSTRRRGAYVPIGGLIHPTAYPNENIVFTGDAAGLVNPLTGEGIYHALLSGFLAAKAYINCPELFKTSYFNLLQDTIVSLKEQGGLLASFYDDSLMNIIFSQLKYYPEYFESICDDVVSLERQSYLSLMIELKNLFR